MTKRMPEKDVDALAQALANPGHLLSEDQWLQERLGSTELWDGLRALSHAVFEQQPCAACAAALPYYTHMEVMGERAAAAYPQVKAHLDECARCSREHATMLQAMSDAYAGQLPVATSYPAFDLSFLPRPAIDWRRLWQDVTSAGASIHRLVTEVAISLAAPFAPLTPPLRPALLTIAAPAQRRREDASAASETIELLDLKYPPANLSIRIGRGPVIAQRTTLLIDVLQIEPPAPVPAARIALCDDQRRLMERMTTDATGSARFEDIGTGRYFIQVRQAEEVWGFPLVIDASSNTPA